MGWERGLATRSKRSPNAMQGTAGTVRHSKTSQRMANGTQVLCDLPSEDDAYEVLRTATSPQF